MVDLANAHDKQKNFIVYKSIRRAHIEIKGYFLIMLYFASCLFGVLRVNTLFFPYFAESIVSYAIQTDQLRFFSCIYLPQFVLYTGLMLSGLSAVGGAAVPILFAFKGYSFGMLLAALFRTYQWNGIGHFWAFFWIPETICLCAMLNYERYTALVSRRLALGCFTSRSGIAAAKETRRMIKSYIFICTVSALFCALATLFRFILIKIFL